MFVYIEINFENSIFLKSTKMSWRNASCYLKVLFFSIINSIKLRLNSKCEWLNMILVPVKCNGIFSSNLTRRSDSSVTTRMDTDTSPPQLDPGLLQAVLADPVLLQAVDPRVLQEIIFQNMIFSKWCVVLNNFIFLEIWEK